MAEIKGMRALRFNINTAGDLNTLVCPPYDIISDAQREEYIQTNPANIIRLELPKGGEDRYEEAGKTLDEWISAGILRQDEKPGIYVYEMEFSGRRLKGFVCLVRLVDFSEGIVLPHEETLSKAKQDRFSLMSATFCNFSQIYSLYMDEDGSAFSAVDQCSQGAPDMEVTDKDGVVHRMWCVSDESIIMDISGKFKEKKLYIADGHHRYETALNFHRHLCECGVEDENGDSGYIMMMLVNMENDGLLVMPTHRIVRGLNNINIGEVVSKCAEFFDITEENATPAQAEERLAALYNAEKKAFTLYVGGKYYTMVLRDTAAVEKLLPEMSKAYCGLDVSILHSLVLERIFGIDKENMANQTNLTYTKIAEEAVSAVDSGAANCAFLLNPTRVSEIRDVAAAGEKMPQKSTYFYPKLITGLAMNKFR